MRLVYSVLLHRSDDLNFFLLTLYQLQFFLVSVYILVGFQSLKSSLPVDTHLAY